MPNLFELLLILMGGLIMLSVMLSAIGRTAIADASEQIDTRRQRESERHAADLLAEAAGRAAALEPLALNADGTIEEPIVAMVEKQ
jgi:hypothetical protein